METSFCISAYPRLGIMSRIAVLVIVILAVFVAAATGMPLPEAITMVTAAGLAAGPVAQVVLPSPAAGAIG